MFLMRCNDICDCCVYYTSSKDGACWLKETTTGVKLVFYKKLKHIFSVTRRQLLFV